jgi:hypothetical protein
MVASINLWSLTNLERLLGPSVDHGKRLTRCSSGGVLSAYMPGPFTFLCGCLAGDVVSGMILHACSPRHAGLNPDVAVQTA